MINTGEANTMKKYLFLILLIALTLTGCGATKSAKLVEEQQLRGKESNRIFDAWTGKTDFASYVIEKSDEMTKEKASAITKKIQEDADKVDAYFGSKTKKIPTIYVIESNVFSGEKMEYEYALGNALYASEEDVNNGNYLGMLIHMTRDIPQTWMCYGIAGEVSGKTADTKALKEFYSNEPHMETLLLSDIRFVQTIAKDNTDIAKKTAVAFWQSFKHEKNIQKYCKELANKNLTKEKNVWLQSMDVNQKYESTYEGSMGKVKGDYNREYDLYVTTPDGEFHINRAEADAFSLETSPYYLERIFYNNMMGLKQVREYFKKENALEIFPCNEKLNYFFESKENLPIGYTDTDKREIIVCGNSQDYGHIHEAVHIYTIKKTFQDLSKIELSEGIATYIADKISKEYSQLGLKIQGNKYTVEDQRYNVNFMTTDATDSNWKQKQEETKKCYLEMGGKTDNPDDYNGILYADAFSKAYYRRLTQEKLDKNEEYQFKYHYHYFFSESFVNYLANTYSFRKVCELYNGIQNGETHESIMGKSEDELIGEWLQKIGVN